MNIFIKESKIQFRNPHIGQPTRAVVNTTMVEGL